MIIDTFNNKPYILHMPGMGKRNAGSFLYFGKENEISVSPEIAIVTIATDDILDSCPLIYQLNKNNIPYINAAEYYDYSKEWKKVDKLSLLIQAFEAVTTEYVLVTDANDAVILRDLDHGFISKWDQYDCNILYNAGQYNYPKELCIPKEMVDWDNVRNMNVYTNHYLNAGVCFGKLEAIKQFYKQAHDIYKSGEHPPMDSEQYYVKLAYWHRNDVKIDNGCHLFLCSHGT